MCKKQTEQENQVIEEFPHYLSNRPKGEDLFEGKSQERLAQTVAAHIAEVDKTAGEGKQPSFARLIGLEGKWGSGKSNVIRILEKDYLKDYYNFFNFDAWGNQEDLQRRSILELLTKHLIDTGKLTGMTKMRVMKPEGEGKVEERTCTWKEKLESLLSRKSYTRDITVPSFNGWSKVFVLMLLITGLLIPFLDLVAKDDLCWWAHLAIVVGPMLLFLFLAWVTGNIGPMWNMYNTEGKSDTTSYVISEQEPSVREFKEWMTEVSEGLPKNEKLVLVFDNMDRLPSEKVHQFWSLIQTFFADDGYCNIWCVIPYDESHLAAVFSDGDSEGKRVKLLRGFLDKTFPVVFRVPEPIIADYKNIFEQLFREAFGSTMDDDSLELISQCYRYKHPTPNVREIISFINNNVKQAKQWKDSISPISRAVYVLTADDILHHPQLPEESGGDFKNVSTDEYILANGFNKTFDQLLFGKVKLATMQREIAAMVYGIEPTEAGQIVVRRYIRNCISGTDPNASLVKYADNHHFMLLLQEDVQTMSVTDYERTASLINDIDPSNLSQKDKGRLDAIWRHFAEHFNALEVPVMEYSDYHKIIFSHVDASLTEHCVTMFSKRLIENTKDVDGTQLYEQLTALYNEDYARSFDVKKVCPSITIDGKRFVDYVKRAGTDYKRFPLKAKPDDLNVAIEESIDKTFLYLDVLRLLKDDSDYTVAKVGNYSVQQLDLKEASAQTAANYIAIQRIFYPAFQSQLDANYVATIWQEAQTEEAKTAYDEIFTLRAIGANEQLPHDDRHVSILMDRVLFYTTTTQLLKNQLAYPSIHFRNSLLKKMINDKKHDDMPDYSEFIEHWQDFVNNLGVTRNAIIQFADSWGYVIPETANAKTYFTLLSDTAWIDVLLAENTPLAGALLKKCVSEMAQQPIEQFVATNNVTHTGNNWSVALQKLIGTNYITLDTFGRIAAIAVSLLDYAAKTAPTGDSTWQTLLAKVPYAVVSSQFNDIRNHILNGESGYVMNPTKFVFLHGWLEQSDINNDSHCRDAANQILAKVIEDAECQNIILENRDYYKPVLSNTQTSASALHDGLKSVLKNQSDSEFAAYVRECVDYGAEEEKE